MKISTKEIALYLIIAVIVVAVVAYFVSSNSNQPISVLVKLSQLTKSSVVYPYQPGEFSVTVNNTGKGPVNNLYVALYINGKVASSSSRDVSLPPGTSATYNVPVLYQTNGTFTIQAIADPSSVMNIQNRTTAQSSITLHVSSPQLPDIYKTIPNSNASTTESFELFKPGLGMAWFISAQYSLAPFNNMLGAESTLLPKMYGDMSSPYISIGGIDGAYSKYNNGTAAYSAWIQSTVNQSNLNYLVSSFPAIKSSNYSVQGTTGTYAVVNNRTSLCYFYSNGWTKMLEYYNASASATCKNITANTYNDVQTVAFANAYRSDASLKGFVGNFLYRNSSGIGFALIGGSNSNALTAINMSENSYGFFATYVKRNQPPLSLNSLNLTCPGLVYASPNVSVCNVGVPLASGANGSASYFLVNSTQLTKNYTFHVFSLVNRSATLSAQGSAYLLITQLNANTVVAEWNSTIGNQCSINSTAPIKCRLASFNYVTGIANMTLKNPTAQPIFLNRIACYVPGFELNTTLNQTIAVNSSTSVNIKCLGSIPGYLGSIFPYQLTINYTKGTFTGVADGYVNITV